MHPEERLGGCAASTPGVAEVAEGGAVAPRGRRIYRSLVAPAHAISRVPEARRSLCGLGIGRGPIGSADPGAGVHAAHRMGSGSLLTVFGRRSREGDFIQVIGDGPGEFYRDGIANLPGHLDLCALEHERVREAL